MLLPSITPASPASSKKLAMSCPLNGSNLTLVHGPAVDCAASIVKKSLGLMFTFTA